VQEIARSCGTSPATIHRHYYVAIDAAEAGHRLPAFEQQLEDAVAQVRAEALGDGTDAEWIRNRSVDCGAAGAITSRKSPTSSRAQGKAS
jgi:hypothetical protein